MKINLIQETLNNLSVASPSSPTLSSDGTSWCVVPTGPRPVAGVKGCPVVVGCAVARSSDCGRTVEARAVEPTSCTVRAGWDETVVRGSLVGGAPASVERRCGEVLRCAVGVDKGPSAAAESGNVRGVWLYQFKTVQVTLHRKQTPTYTQPPEVTLHHPDHGNYTPTPPSVTSYRNCITINAQQSEVRYSLYRAVVARNCPFRRR